jgi:predicted phage terminase large subunit-like protein
MPQELSLTNQQSLEEKCQAKVYQLSLKDFGQDFFESIELVPYVHGKHIDVLARHLEAVARKNDKVGRIKRLLINLPPSTSKSIWVNVIFPAWVWSWWPQAQFLMFSNTDALVKRDHDKCWNLVNSARYQRYFPNVRIERGQDQATFLGLTAGGDRRCATPGSALNTGIHPDFIIAEDPMTVGDSASRAKRREQEKWYFDSLSSRGIAKDCVHIVCQQRIHVDDLSGCIKDQDKKLRTAGKKSPWVFLVMPMRFTPERAMEDIGYGGDWRTERDQPLFPELLTEERIEVLEAGLSREGPNQIESQMQQNPQRGDGALFKVTNIPADETFAMFPKEFDELHRHWDLAGTEGGGCETAGALIGRKGDHWYLLDMVAGHWDGADVETQIEATAYMDWGKYNRKNGVILHTSFEQEPASSAKRYGEIMEAKWVKYDIRKVPPEKNKAGRAGPLATLIKNGFFHMPVDAPWYSETMDQFIVFTGDNTGLKDRVDATSGAVLEIMHPTREDKKTLTLAAKSSVGSVDSYHPHGRCQCEVECKIPAFAGTCCCLECEATGGEKHSRECMAKYNDWYIKNSPD